MWLVESSHPLVSLGTVIGRRREVGRGGGDLGVEDGGMADRRRRRRDSKEDGRRGAEDNWVVYGMEKGGGGRVILLNCFGTIAVSIYLLLCYFIGVMGRNAQCMSAATNISAGRSYPCLSILPRLFL